MKIVVNYFPGHAGPKIMRGFIRAFRRLGHEVIDMTCEPFMEYCDIFMGYSGTAIIPFPGFQYTAAHIMQAKLIQYWADDFNVEDVKKQGLIVQTDRGCSTRWNEAGLRNVYQPLATDPEVFRPLPLVEDFDVLVTGIPSEGRLRVLRQLTGLKVGIFGQWQGFWEKFPEFHHLYRGCVGSEKELNELYNRSRLYVDMSSPQNLDSANFTVFNVMATSCVLVTNYKPALHDLFGDAAPPTYTDDCRPIVDKLLNRGDLLDLAMAQRQVVCAAHTFDHRATEILSLLENEPRLDLPPDLRKEIDEALSLV